MLLDTSAWLAYFREETGCHRVGDLLRERTTLFTCPLTVAELARWLSQIGEQIDPYLRVVKRRSQFTELTEDVLRKSGMVCSLLRQQRSRIGLVGCIIYTSSVLHGQMLLTKDTDFAGLPGVEML